MSTLRFPAYAVWVICTLFVTHRAVALDGAGAVYQKAAEAVVVVVGLTSKRDLKGYGSGVVIAPGQVITNCHVIESSAHIGVGRSKAEGKQISIARVVYANNEQDLCLLDLEEPKAFQRHIAHFAPLETVAPGKRVFAIGSPYGLELSITDGIVSAIRKHKGVSFIQNTAPIGPGSSGGGLFDSEGRLIGITTSQVGETQGLNFAMPAEYAYGIVARVQARKQEELRRAEAERLRREAEERRQRELARQEELKRLEAERRRLEQERKLIEAERQRQTEQARLAELAEEVYREEKARGLGQLASEHALLTPELSPEERVLRLEEARRAFEAQQRAEAIRRLEEERRRQEQQQAAAAREQQQRLIDDYRAGISAKIRVRVIVPPDMEGNPQAVYEVTVLPGGDVLGTRLVRSSGVPAYDAAVERAIRAAQPLPVPEDPNLFHQHFRRLTLSFRPRE